MFALTVGDQPALRIGWMRHGTSLDGEQRPRAHARPDTDLSEGGRAEAVAAAEQLRAQSPSLIIASPLRRAAITAELLSDALGVPLIADVGEIVEWRAPACVLGVTPEEYPPQYQHWRENRAQRPHSALPGGESLSQFNDRAARAAQVVRGYAERFGPGAVIAVSHKLLIGAVAAHHTGIVEPSAVFTHASSFALAPASVWWAGS